jgi:hypothetical protein
MGGAPSAPQEEYYCPDLAGVWLSTRCSEWTNDNIGSHKTRARMPNTKMTYGTDGKGEGWVGDLYVFVAARPNGPGRYVAKGVIKLLWSASDGELTLSDGNNALQVRYPSNGIVEYWRREGSGAGGGQQQDQLAALAQARAQQEAEAEAAEARLREQRAAEARARQEAEAAEARRREHQAAEARARQEAEAAEARRREQQAAAERARREAEAAAAAAEAAAAAAEAAAAASKQPASGTETMSEEEIDTMSIKELRSYITQAGMSFADCIEKSELRARAKEAAAAKGGVVTEAEPDAAAATTAGEGGGGGRQAPIAEESIKMLPNTNWEDIVPKCSCADFLRSSDTVRTACPRIDVIVDDCLAKAEEVRKRYFLSVFDIKTIILPRQARDKHRGKALKKERLRFLAAAMGRKPPRKTR